QTGNWAPRKRVGRWNVVVSPNWQPSSLSILQATFRTESCRHSIRLQGFSGQDCKRLAARRNVAQFRDPCSRPSLGLPRYRGTCWLSDASQLLKVEIRLL